VIWAVALQSVIALSPPKPKHQWALYAMRRSLGGSTRMQIIRPLIIVGLAAAALSPPAAIAEEPAAIGQAEKVQASVTAEGGGKVRALAAASPLFFGDALASQNGARLEARLADDTQLTLGENARLVIDDFIYSPGAPGARLALRVLQGTFLFVGGRTEASEGGEVQIATTFATLGVRGTTVWGGPIDGACGVLVLDGEGVVTNAGQSVTRGAGQGTTIAGPQAAPQPVVAWPQDKVDRAIATISFQ
jgi:hypothetical protein